VSFPQHVNRRDIPTTFAAASSSQAVLGSLTLMAALRPVGK
jgi:hypothetical protein